MFTPAAFVEDNPAELAALIRAFPLASLIVSSSKGPLVAYAPLLPEQDAQRRITGFIGHLARANPFWAAAQEAQVLVLFSGPDAYVSPSFYASKKEHGKVVPTWNYARIEARGRMVVETDPSRVRPYFEQLTDAFEQDRADPWGVDDAPANYVNKLQHALVGVHITVDDIRGAVKLSQNRNEADRMGVRDGLMASPRHNDQAAALMMKDG